MRHNFNGSGISILARRHGRARRVRGDVGVDLERSADRERTNRRLESTFFRVMLLKPDGDPFLRQGRDRICDGRSDNDPGCTQLASRSASASVRGGGRNDRTAFAGRGVLFAVLGILLGHLLTADSIGPAVGGLVLSLALVSGPWSPFGSHGFLHDIAQFLSPDWLVQASHVSLGGHAWTVGGLDRRGRLDGRAP